MPGRKSTARPFLKGLIVGIFLGGLAVRLIPGFLERESSPQQGLGIFAPGSPTDQTGNPAHPVPSAGGRVSDVPQGADGEPGAQAAGGTLPSASSGAAGQAKDGTRANRHEGAGASHAPAEVPGRDSADSRAPTQTDDHKPLSSPGADRAQALIKQVIDGDTVMLSGGDLVRILGIDTPERDEPFYGEARDYLGAAVHSGTPALELCSSESRDRYGRRLAFLEVSGRDVSAELLLEGLARTLIMGTCTRPRSTSYRRLEREAFRAGRGIWSLQKPRRVAQSEAGDYIGWLMTVTGSVRKVHTGPRAIHLNFGADYRTDFTGVIYRKDLSRLTGEGLKPITAYSGQAVEITGVIKEYQGPEIIVEAADQIDISH